MRKVHRFVEIDTPVKVCYEKAKNIEEIAKGMENIKEMEIIERIGNRTKTRWKGVLQVASFAKEMEWIEEDEWNDAELVCEFWQNEGAFRTYRGKWWFEDIGNGRTKSHIEIEYDIGLPIGGPVVEKLVEKIVAQNVDSLLKSLKKVCEGK